MENLAPEAHVAENVRAWREETGVSQVDLAQRMQSRGLPFHQATIYKLEGGTRAVRVNEAVVLAEIMGIELSELVANRQEEGELAKSRRLLLRAQGEVDQMRDALAPIQAALARNEALLREATGRYEVALAAVQHG